MADSDLRLHRSPGSPSCGWYPGAEPGGGRRLPELPLHCSLFHANTHTHTEKKSCSQSLLNATTRSLGMACWQRHFVCRENLESRAWKGSAVRWLWQVTVNDFVFIILQNLLFAVTEMYLKPVWSVAHTCPSWLCCRSGSLCLKHRKHFKF